MNSRTRRALSPAALTVCCLLATIATSGLTAPLPARAEGPARVLDAEGTASLQARTTGRPVEVVSMLSETTRVMANPDGTFTAEVHAGPVRYRNAGGKWKSVDLTLQRRADGTVAPKGHPRGLVISGAAGAGDHDLARLASGSTKLALGWAGTLPQPQLDGTTATYREVRPGLDLVIDATRTGFEQFLIVKNRAAAAQVKTVDLPWRTEGVDPSSTKDGGLTLRDKRGGYVGHVPPAVMWDATVGTKSGDHLHEAPVAMSVRKAAGARLALVPEHDFLSDPATRYPVTIDPSPTLKPGFDTFVQDNISSDQSTKKELKLGYVDDEGTFKARSFIRWSTGALVGKRVTAATMYLWNTHSWSCAPREWQVWITGGVGTTTNWSKQPTWYDDRPIAKSSMTKGYSGCGAGYVTADVQPLFAWASQQGLWTLTTGLRGNQADVDNANSHSWKKFESSEDAKDPYVSLTYNTVPLAPSTLRIGGKACGSGDPAAFVSKAAGNPSAQATIADPDGTERNLTVQFFLAKAGTALPGSPTMSKTATSGSIATVAIPGAVGLVENQAYTMYARTYDGLDTSAWSAVCNFTIDSTGPAFPPTVTSTDYPECLLANCVPTGGVGVSGTFTFGAHGVADVVQYRYWFDGGAKVTVAAPSRGAAVSTTVDPPAIGMASRLKDLKRGGPRVLHVVSVDQAGRESGEYAVGTGDGSVGGYQMLVGSAPDPTGWWKFDEPSGAEEAQDSSPNAHPLILGDAVSSGEGAGDGGRALFFGPDSGAVGDLAVDLKRSRTTSAMVRVTAFGEGEMAIVKHDHPSARIVTQRPEDLRDFLFIDGSTKRVCYQVDANSATPDTTTRPYAGEWRVCSSQAISPGVWTSVAGGFDAMRQEVTVYVNGVRAASSTVGGFTGSTGSIRSVRTAVASGTLTGAVDDMRTWNRVLQPQEVGALASIEVGRWDLDQGGGDISTHPVHHVVTGAAAPDDLWNDFGHVDSDGGSGWLDGTNAFSSTGRVLRTDQSFSVSAWANLSVLNGANQTVLGQDGSVLSNFYLGVRNINGGPRWCLSAVSADSASFTFDHACSGAVIVDDDLGSWVHLVGVYDASAQRIQLYVDGTLAATSAKTSRWLAGGSLTIGRSLYQGRQLDYFTGSVDAVRAYAGVLTPDMVKRLYQTQDGQL